MAFRRPAWTRNGIAVALGATAVMIAFAFAFNWLANRTITDTGSLDLPSFTASPSTTTSADATAATLLAVGDIATCDGEADDRVAALAAELPGTIALVGDLVYPQGTAANYRKCFEPSWGPMLSRIRPALGNHDYTGGSAQPYFNLFGAAAGEKGDGWYSYELGAWHVVVLNSNCDKVGGCDDGSPQMSWLQSDLAAHPSACLLAYWHHPRWSSGRHGNQEQTDPFWKALTEAGVDVVLGGHDHDYERLDVDGVMSFVVGTGGRSRYRFENDPYPSTEARQDTAYGLLELQLRDGSFEWQYLVLGKSGFTDAGAATC